MNILNVFLLTYQIPEQWKEEFVSPAFLKGNNTMKNNTYLEMEGHTIPDNPNRHELNLQIHILFIDCMKAQNQTMRSELGTRDNQHIQ
jgi:hypothetical protein